jgi:hypothetical protein
MHRCLFRSVLLMFSLAGAHFALMAFAFIVAFETGVESFNRPSSDTSFVSRLSGFLFEFLSQPCWIILEHIPGALPFWAEVAAFALNSFMWGTGGFIILRLLTAFVRRAGLW